MPTPFEHRQAASRAYDKIREGLLKRHPWSPEDGYPGKEHRAIADDEPFDFLGFIATAVDEAGGSVPYSSLVNDVTDYEFATLGHKVGTSFKVNYPDVLKNARNRWRQHLDRLVDTLVFFDLIRTDGERKKKVVGLTTEGWKASQILRGKGNLDEAVA